jgi:hypothetical protein
MGTEEQNQPVSQGIESKSEGKKEKKNWVVEWLRFKNRRLRTAVLVTLTVFGLLAFLALGYLCIFVWLPMLWAWGFDPLTWKAILSVLGAIYLVIIPFMPFAFLGDTVAGVLKLYAEDAEKEFTDRMNEIEQKQQNYESKLNEKDTEGLIPLITYSRIELEQYYKIGLSQTQKSYRYSITAMWLGFLIIAFGILSYIVPTKYINENLVSGNLQLLTIASGIFTEFISALFLWIYKSSVNRLTYFYNRQVFIHNALLAYKISNTMTDPDKAKTIIVEKILDYGVTSNKESFISLSGKG